MLYLAMLLTAGAIVGLDQFTKYLTVSHIPEGGVIPVWPGVFHLTYIRNSGAAFSMLEGARILFLLLTLLFLAGAVACIVKKKIRHPLGQWALVLVAGGAVGNLIDRMAYGSVVDMIELEFMRFAIFNVADCFVTVGAALLIVWAIFLDRRKPGAPEGTAHDDTL